MPKDYYKINGHNDYELTSVGLWFAITFLYACNINTKEKRYKNVSKYLRRIDIIKKCSLYQVESWIDYAHNELRKGTKNLGNVSLLEQKHMARDLKDFLNKGNTLSY